MAEAVRTRIWCRRPQHVCNALERKETVRVQSESKIYKPGQWLILGAALGAFIGLLLGKFALGLIFGFFAGIAIDSAKRRASKGGSESGADDDAKD